MKKFKVVAASAVALSAALASGSALAHGTLAVTTAKYNAASVAANGGLITVPWNGSASATYTVNANGAGNSLDVNSRFTVTLPTGFTFASPPQVIVGGTLNVNGNTVTPTGAAGQGVGFNTATFFVNQDVLNGGGIPAGGTLSLAQVSVQNAVALETPGAALNISVFSDENSQIDNNDGNPPVPVSPPSPEVTFASDTGVTATFIGGGASIDLGPGSLGSLFGNGPVGSDTTTANIGTITLTSSHSLSADGTMAEALATTDTATLTIGGFFNAIASGTATGANTVTIAPNAGNLVFTDVDVTAPIVVTLTALGTPGTLLQQNPSSTGSTLPVRGTPGFVVNFAPTGAEDFLAGNATDATDSIVYTNGVAIPVTNFLTGTDAGYTSILRVNNAGTSPVQLFALVQPYSGGPQLVGSLNTTLGGGTGTIFFEPTIEGDIPGFHLANSGQRATLTVIAVGEAAAGQVAASDLLVNPGGVVVNVN